MNSEFIKLYDGSYIRKDSIICISSIKHDSFPRCSSFCEFKITLDNKESRLISFEYNRTTETEILDKITEIRNDILMKMDLL